MGQRGDHGTRRSERRGIRRYCRDARTKLRRDQRRSTRLNGGDDFQPVDRIYRNCHEEIWAVMELQSFKAFNNLDCVASLSFNTLTTLSSMVFFIIK